MRLDKIGIVRWQSLRANSSGQSFADMMCARPAHLSYCDIFGYRRFGGKCRSMGVRFGLCACACGWAGACTGGRVVRTRLMRGRFAFHLTRFLVRPVAPPPPKLLYLSSSSTFYLPPESCEAVFEVRFVPIPLRHRRRRCFESSTAVTRADCRCYYFYTM